MRLTRAFPARPISSCTWPIVRRSAPFTGAKSTFDRREATTTRGFPAVRGFAARLRAVVRDGLPFERVVPRAFPGGVLFAVGRLAMSVLDRVDACAVTREA